MCSQGVRSISATAPPVAQDSECSRGGDAAVRLTPDRRLGGWRLVPSAELVGQVIADVPAGRVITLEQLLEGLNQRFGGDRVGPRALRMALRELEQQTVEALVHELEPAVPLWRLVNNDGSVDPHSALNPLFSATRLRAEGHCMTRDRGRWKVLDRADIH